MAKTKRGAATSEKAKNTAALAAAEAKEGERVVEKPVKKTRGRPKKKVSEAKQDELVDEDGPDPQEEEINRISIGFVVLTVRAPSWTTDLALTWTLITVIEEDEETSAGLFPGVGAIKLSGGKPKSHFYYKLAQICFEEHPKYMDVFMNTIKPKQRRAWSNKIKNRLKALVTKAREHITEMGETGAGIGAEDEILPGTALTTKWDLIKVDSPWFFHMRILIAARPNLQPVGLGNNDTQIDTSILIASHDGDDQSSIPDDTDFPDHLSEPAIDVLSSDSDDDILSLPTLTRSVKRKHADDPKSRESDANPARKKTKPQPPVSVPVATPAVPTKKTTTTAKDRFAAAVQAEEETAQQLLRSKQAKTNAKKDVALARIQMESNARAARAEAKKADKVAKMDLARLKMQQEHEFRMVQPISSFLSFSIFGDQPVAGDVML
ncbi:hypothetical protein B0H10DRAFT_2215888 [Mycena sp. CBHHK59/15]|nr:hypothetical protein B0H10DRAFT_2215888 [Mycena sp. CBHHK59/15]